MKKSDVLKTFRKVNEATTDGYTPSESTNLVNKQYVDDIKTYVDEEANNLENIDSITTKKFMLLDNIPLTNATYIQNQDDINKKNLSYYFNLNKILDNFKFGATVLIKINYKNKIDSIPITNIDKSDNSISVFTTSTVLNKAIIFRLYPYKEYNESFETIDSDYSCLSLIFQMGLSEEEIDMINNASITIYVLENKALNKDNEIEYTPSSDYNPSTKKYVDDSIKALEDTNKYKLITCDDPLVINKTDITDIADATVTIDNLTGRYGNLVANEDGTWTYTLNGFMNGLETFTFTVGETTQDLVIVPYKEMVYNDNNAGIGYSGTWDVENNTKYSNGSAHYSSTAKSTATFTFTGTGVDVYSRTNGAVGSIRAILYNGKTTENVNRISYIDNLSESGDYYQIPTLSFKDLDYATYTVEIAVMPTKKDDGTYRSTYYLDGIHVYNSLNITNLKINDLYRLEEKQNNFLHIDRKNAKYSPTHDYDPATKVYVDDLVNSNKINMCTDEEFDSMLASKLVVNEDNDDLVFLQEALPAPN